MNINLVVTTPAGDDVWLDLYPESPIKLTFNIEDIITTTPKAEFTRAFRVPATQNNYNFFSTVFEVNGVDFNPGVKVAARIIINGSDFRTGEFRLQNIYKNKDLNRIDYDCLFIGSAKALASEVGEKNIGDLDWSDYVAALDLAAITGSWQAYPEGGLDSGSFDGNVIFPIIDFGNTYTGNVTNETRIAIGHPTADGGSFEKSNHPLATNRLKPMVRIREIMRRIFEQNGFTFTGSFLTANSRVAKMYLSAWGNDDDIYVDGNNANLAKFIPSAFTTFDGTPGLSQFGGFSNELFDPGNNVSTIVGVYGPVTFYTVPTPGIYKYTLTTNFKFTQVKGVDSKYKFTHSPPGLGSNDVWEFELGPGTGPCVGYGSEFTVTLNGLVILTRYPCQGDWDEIFIDSDTGNEAFSWDYTIAQEYTLPTAIAGEAIFWGVFLPDITNTDNSVNSAEMYQGSFVEITQAVGEYNIADGFNSKHKCMDFLKDVFTMFRLVMVPDPLNPSNFLITPWSNYIGRGELKDWTSKLDVSKDVVVRPLLLDQTDKVVFKMAEDTDIYNDRNQVVFNESFGTKQIDSVYDVLEGERILETKVAPTPASQIEGYNTDWQDFTLPQIHAHDVDDGGVKHEPIKPKPRILFYNGLQSVGSTDFYLTEVGVPSAIAFSEFPVVSFSDQMPQGGPNNYNLTFERETTWADNSAVYNTFTGQDLYGIYWSQYMELLYNKDSRRVTAYFVLDATDILNFRYDDVIYVQGVYYYVEKIYDAPLGQKAKIKVDLITLKNYRPSITAAPQPTNILWENASSNWEVGYANNWEAV